MCAAAPSSGSGAVPTKATRMSTVASAASDRAMGRNALGRRKLARRITL